ncbi:hypothetical protein QAD02_002712 [Eretmocerus hayati]|uniref:Uncharacterized protein n=1 Tax=Eretmocerus hayati TaxID=131215 RepID=A0ACC2NJT9_9HYME|nr:hypothetical protein QAD02_002712 [Eretmocerus hayati]
MRKEENHPSDDQAARGGLFRLVALFNSNSPSWGYFSTPVCSTPILIAQQESDKRITQKCHQWTGYTDNFRSTGSQADGPRGADLNQIPDTWRNILCDKRNLDGNANGLAKKENLTSPASNPDEKRMKCGIRISFKEASCIKALAKLPRASVRVLTSRLVLHPRSELCRDSVCRCFRFSEPGARRWLTGAPGGWWPTKVESDPSDGDGPSYSPHPSPIRMDRRETVLIVIDSPDDESTKNSEIFGIYPSDDDLPTQSPSPKKGRVELSVTFGSSSLGSVVRPSPTSTTDQPASSASATSPARQRRRSRQKRTARNAKWASSFDKHVAISEQFSPSLNSEVFASKDSEADDMIFSYTDFDRLMAVYWATLDPEDGVWLQNYVGENVTHTRNSAYLENWRKNKRDAELHQLRRESRNADDCIDELRESLDASAPTD